MKKLAVTIFTLFIPFMLSAQIAFSHEGEVHGSSGNFTKPPVEIGEGFSLETLDVLEGASAEEIRHRDEAGVQAEVKRSIVKMIILSLLVFIIAIVVWPKRVLKNEIIQKN